MRRVALSVPGYVEPMLPTLVESPPEGDDWLHEIKYDGYRTIVAVDGVDTRAYTRNGHDWSAKYDMIVHEAAGLRCDTAILDGEMIVQNQDGVSDFGALRSAITAAPERLILYAFDLMMLNGKDLRGLALTERRKHLQDLVGHHPESRIHFSEDLVGNGPEVFRAADRLGLEGIVSKRPEGRYMSGDRSRLWLKTKTFATSVFDIHRRREEPRPAFPIALLADGGTYVGNAMVTLSGKDRAAFWKRIDALGTPQAHGSWPCTSARARNGSSRAWSRPSGICAARRSCGTRRSSACGRARRSRRMSAEICAGTRRCCATSRRRYWLCLSAPSASGQFPVTWCVVDRPNFQKPNLLATFIFDPDPQGHFLVKKMRPTVAQQLGSIGHGFDIRVSFALQFDAFVVAMGRAVIDVKKVARHAHISSCIFW